MKYLANKFKVNQIIITIIFFVSIMLAFSMLIFGFAQAEESDNFDNVANDKNGTLFFQVGLSDFNNASVVFNAQNDDGSDYVCEPMYYYDETITIDGREYYLYEGEVPADGSAFTQAWFNINIYGDHMKAVHEGDDFYPTENKNTAYIHMGSGIDYAYDWYVEPVEEVTITSVASLEEAGSTSPESYTCPVNYTIKQDGEYVFVYDNDDNVACKFEGIPNVGFYVSGWSGVPEKLSSDVTITCVFDQISSTIVFDSCGGQGGPESIVVKVGEKPRDLSSSELPVIEGKNFAGYFDDNDVEFYDKDGKSLIDSWEITESMYTLYAKYNDITNIRTEPLVFDISDASMDGGEENWKWDSDTSTLYLNGINFKNYLEIGNRSGNSDNKDVNIFIDKGVKNTIEIDDNVLYRTCILFYNCGSLNISGEGELDLVTNFKDNDGEGILFFEPQKDSLFNVENTLVKINSGQSAVYASNSLEGDTITPIFDLNSCLARHNDEPEAPFQWFTNSEYYCSSFVMSEDNTKEVTNLIINPKQDVEPASSPSSDGSENALDNANQSAASSLMSTGDINILICLILAASLGFALFVVYRVYKKQA